MTDIPTHKQPVRLATAALLGLTVMLLGPAGRAQSADSVVPYKLGTFAKNGRSFPGLVLRDTQVLDIAQANAVWQARNATAPKLSPPQNMKQLIERYESGWRERLQAIARAETAAHGSPGYSYPINSLKVLPPVAPAVVLNADSNYDEHLQNIYKRFAAQGTPLPPPSKPTSMPGLWERKPDDTRSKNPGMFLKSPTVITGANDPIEVPRGRPLVDWECEFDLVIGKTAKYVPIEKAADYIFGYTIQIDVSDRDLRGVPDNDMLVMKNHDTFGPLGPVIVPKEFMPQPMNARQVFTLNGTVMQDYNTSRMTHNIYELLNYGSTILTLHAGDIISAGSPPGTNLERTQPRWMKAGDTAVCTIEGIGTQTHPVINEPVS